MITTRSGRRRQQKKARRGTLPAGLSFSEAPANSREPNQEAADRHLRIRPRDYGNLRSTRARLDLRPSLSDPPKRRLVQRQTCLLQLPHLKMAIANGSSRGRGKIFSVYGTYVQNFPPFAGREDRLRVSCQAAASASASRAACSLGPTRIVSFEKCSSSGTISRTTWSGPSSGV